MEPSAALSPSLTTSSEEADERRPSLRSPGLAQGRTPARPLRSGCGGPTERPLRGKPVEKVPSDEQERGEEGANRGAISQLQEFVQGAKIYPMPPNCRVLQWDYETRMSGTSLKFKALVAFLLDGVPHHVAGAWKPSKKLAQRDTAERTLGLFVNRWGELALTEHSEAAVPVATRPSRAAEAAETQGAQGAQARLLAFCETLASYVTSPPRFSSRVEANGLCQAFVELGLLEVPHTFPGRPCRTAEDALTDAARRVLWYLQCPGYEEAFEPDVDFVRQAAQTIPGPATAWVRGEACEDGEEQQLAERKTTIMRVQNRLQQAYARQLEAGTSPWYWTFEKDPRDRGWPPLCRATVHVPLAGRTFVGEWFRGQREAQISTCTQISEFLDREFPRTKG